MTDDTFLQEFTSTRSLLHNDHESLDRLYLMSYIRISLLDIFISGAVGEGGSSEKCGNSLFHPNRLIISLIVCIPCSKHPKSMLSLGL